ncbi:MAG: hypothetical protein HXY34_12865 [Candidatus Thorarchaeota archaeon]|nr:hypothetical protein [Candidatus Thorarchaeota archaeon]
MPPIHGVLADLTEQSPTVKNKLFKGLTPHDVLMWEEEKMKHQKRVGRKVTDLEFLRHLLVWASYPVVYNKEGVTRTRSTAETR